MNTYNCTDGNGDLTIRANTPTEAAQEYVAGGDWGDRSKTIWIDVWVTPRVPGPTREQLMIAIRAADIDDSCVTAHANHLLISVDESYDLDALISELPLGATAEWAGSSNTDSDGNTTEDIRVTWEDEIEDEDAREYITITLDADEPDCNGDEHDWQSPHEVVGGLKENPGVYGKGGGAIITEVCRCCGCYRITDTWAQRSDTGEQGLESVEYRDADDESLAWVEKENADCGE